MYNKYPTQEDVECGGRYQTYMGGKEVESGSTSGACKSNIGAVMDGFWMGQRSGGVYKEETAGETIKKGKSTWEHVGNSSS